MRYVICWFEGKRWGKGFYVFYPKEGWDITICSKFTDLDGKVHEPFISTKRKCEFLRDIKEIDGKIIPLWLGRLFSIYNSIYDAYINHKLGI